MFSKRKFKIQKQLEISEWWIMFNLDLMSTRLSKYVEGIISLRNIITAMLFN